MQKHLITRRKWKNVSRKSRLSERRNCYDCQISFIFGAILGGDGAERENSSHDIRESAFCTRNERRNVLSGILCKRKMNGTKRSGELN